ncbi:F7-2 fimbrial protein, partial [Salmonella enterica subsp. enterica serovar Virginia]|nr:F7-2 fimbrial protein [Salmonella enterica subsp. enterica serovar Virginia]
MKKRRKLTVSFPSSRTFRPGLAAAESGDGTIKFTGEIVDAPCVVSTDSQNREVVLGQVKKNIFK